METNQNVGSLQELINTRAENRLKGDLRKLIDLLISNPLLMGNYTYKPKLSIQKDGVEGEKIFTTPDTIDRLLNTTWGDLYKEMYSNYLPDYISEETQIFVDKVTELEQSVNNLLDVNLPY